MRAIIEDYSARLEHFVRCEIVELRESAISGNRTGIEAESSRIIGGLHSDAVTILLDVEGRELSSPQLAAEIEKWQNNGTKEIEFVIGGALGVSATVADRIKTKWSLSRFTLTHEMARVVLIEQLYRAYTIIHGLPYQK